MSKYSKEKLERLILDEGLSYEEIGRKFKISGNAVKKAALRFGIELPQRRNVSNKETFNKGVSILNKVCDNRFIEIINTSTGWNEIINKLGYRVNKSNTRKNILKRCEQLRISPNTLRVSVISSKTKSDLFAYRKNWQSARSSIQKDARKIYFYNNKHPKCAICGYTKHVEVAHIKAVSEFSNETPISTINSITNLVGLCPNHHWEYDNGMLKI